MAAASTLGYFSGAFLGYNTQWQDLILGVEAIYTHTNLNTTAPSTPIGRSAAFEKESRSSSGWSMATGSRPLGYLP